MSRVCIRPVDYRDGHECDRCGRLCTNKNKAEMAKWARLRLKAMNDHSAGASKQHLCHKCVQSFEAWMKQEQAQ